jgi:hypothetical protein
MNQRAGLLTRLDKVDGGMEAMDNPFTDENESPSFHFKGHGTTS